ncbi:helix-turn-helix domain-containing protein [Arcicella sp. LKC2W]|uniref:helix-turn-helix domain-containing protein n=1 Tax=Arcicella sp. LKC2W TaxID=2984198 RepID=UPI002B211DF1|nr:helix-turn-helix domain-containing protein [Arcicella sp. LKC2W]MEA5459831.1 helix-turn-helix domain-containing protein [Arcicella sp. LKC2W]
MENKFSANIRVLRKKNKLTLEALGKILGVSKSALSDYENGHTVPSLDVCETIGSYFSVNLDELQNSDFSEMTLEEIKQNNKLRNSNKKEEDKNDLSNPYNQLVFQNKLLNQQVEGLQIQLQLVKQLFESKVSEIKSLQVQIKLLEEKLNH